MYGQGTASLKFGNCWDTGVVKLFVDGNEISSVGPHSEQTVIFDFVNNTTIQIEEDSGIILFHYFEIPLCNAVCDNVPRVNNIKNAETETVSGWHFDLEYGTWNFGHMVVGGQKALSCKKSAKGTSQKFGSLLADFFD